jgi:hypothetical protein
MSSDSSGAEQGTLLIWVPHWAATVRLFDNDYKPIATLGTQTDTREGRYPVRFELAAGVYRVDVELSGTTDTEWVSIRPRKETVIPVERWSNLQLLTPAPLDVSPNTASPAPAAWASEAEQWSRQVTWTSPRAGAARLFVFVQTPDSKKYPNFANGLALLDEHSSPVVELASPQARVDAAAGWLAFSTDLTSGHYILSRRGPGAFRYGLPLFLCDGWETQLFLVGGKGPSFRSLTIHMAPHGYGFRRDDQIAAAVDAVLAALRRESAIATVVRSAHLKKLLHSEDKNPWLAVLAAYALTLAEEERYRPSGEPTRVAVDPGLKQEILQFLQARIGSHPDVRALLLDPEAAAPEPFPFPPLVRIGLQRVQTHATRFASTVPLNSLTERAVTQLVTSSPWSVWAEPIPATAAAGQALPLAESDAVPAAKRPTLRRGVRRVAGVAGLGASAPVFRPTAKAKSAKAATTELREALYDLPVFKAAQQMIGDAAQPLHDRVVLNTTEAAGKLLAEIQPEALSTIAGIPLSRAQETLDQLKATLGKASTLTKGTAIEGVVLQYALRQGSAGSWAEPGIIDPSEASSATARSSLEECVSALRNATALLSAMTRPGSATLPPGIDRNVGTASDAIRSEPALRTRAERVAARLTALSDALLERADFIVLTTASGKFLYANGAFTLLAREASGAKGLDTVCRKWSEWLHTLPLGRSTGVKSPADPDARVWTVRRVAVEDEGSKRRTVFVNVLENDKRSPLSDETFEYLASVASTVTLNASFLQYGSVKRVAASLDTLEGIAERLETMVPVRTGSR